MLAAWLLAIRPKTLIAALSPVCMGTVVAATNGYFNPWIFFATLLTGLGIQILTNLVNDFYDFQKGADTSSRKGPVRALQQGLMTLTQTKRAILSVMGVTGLFSLFLIMQGGAIISILMILALLFAFAYTAGPYPLSYLGIAEGFVLIFFGPVATGMTYYLQTHTLNLTSFLVGLSPGLISCSLMIMNNLRDEEEDRKANKKTLVVRKGSLFGKLEYSTALILALLVPLFFAPHHPFLVITLLCFIPLIPLLKNLFSSNNPYSYIPLFEKTGKLLNLYTLIFCLTWWL